MRAAGWGLAGLFFGTWGALNRGARGEQGIPNLSQVRSILAIRMDLLGDLVFTLPALRALREAAPQALLTVLVLPYTADLVRGLPCVDRVIAADVNRWRQPSAWLDGTAWQEMWAAMAEIRQEPYDLCVSFYGRLSGSVALLSGARHRVGYLGEGHPWNFNLGLPGGRYQKRQHEVEYCLDLVRALGVSASYKRVEPVVDPTAARRVDLLLLEAGVGPEESLVALHAGALNMAAKRWLPDRWAAVADRVQRELGVRLVLVGSTSEQPLVDRVRESMVTLPVVMAGRTSVLELVALLKRCRLFLGGDSGPLHLASALGVPSVSVYGPTDPANTGPLGARAMVLRGAGECGPCYDPATVPLCRRGELLCMSSVSVDRVFEAAREALSGSGEPVPLGVSPGCARTPLPPNHGLTNGGA